MRAQALQQNCRHEESRVARWRPVLWGCGVGAEQPVPSINGGRPRVDVGFLTSGLTRTVVDCEIRQRVGSIEDGASRHEPSVQSGRRRAQPYACRRRRPAERQAPGTPSVSPPRRRVGCRQERHPCPSQRARARGRSTGHLQDESRERRIRLPGVRVARRHQGAATGHLRERHQARYLGDDIQAGRCRLLRPPHRL